MRIQIQTTRRPQGNILLVTLLTCFILGMGLASYLTLVSSQNYSVMRSLAWNSAIPLVEAGAEEALTQLHQNGITNLASNGWSLRSDYGGSYYIRRALGDSYFEAFITPTDPPVIHSHGYVPVPLHSGGFVGALLASVTGNDTRTAGYVSRKVRLTTKNDALFAKGLVADGEIDLKGNRIITDSFDSENPLYSDNGKYPFLADGKTPNIAKIRYNGDVATNSGLIGALDVGNAEIKGKVATGPGGSVDIGPSGRVGDAAWHLTASRGIQPGYVSDDMNVDFKKVTVPESISGYSTPGGRTVDGENYNYVLDNGDYELSNLGGKVLVTGDAVLHVTHNLSFTGNDFLEIAPGASLQIFMSGTSANFSGNGEWNKNGSALSLQYWGLPSNTSVSIGGNSSFTGTIYAPQAALTLNGGGSDNYDFVGASISKTAKLNGKVQFHYDEALERLGPDRGYVVNSWNEL
jgi:hypothetical protein